MNKTNKIMLTLAICSALQACSSASDMSVSAGNTDSSQVTVPESTLPAPDTGAAIENPAVVPDTDTSTAIENPTVVPDSGTGDGTTTANTPDSTVAQLVANASSVDCDAPSDVFQNTMLAVINESRSSARMCGTGNHPAVNTLTWNDALASAADAHAIDMMTFNFFDHDGSDGLSVSDRAQTAGYNWRAIGENIAAGQSEIAEVHEGWLDSPGHCRNIMNTLYSEVGAACVVSDNNDFSSYWVVVFGDQL